MVVAKRWVTWRARVGARFEMGLRGEATTGDGSTESPLGQRFARHKGSQLHDPLACPLYRHVRENGGWDGWTIEPVSTTQYDADLTPDLPRYMETMAIKSLQRAGDGDERWRWWWRNAG
eukprot:COSAG02_NODE_2949_length_7680_cov_4.274238_5_plen_119_part_00